MKWNNFYKKIVVNEFYFCYDFDTLISMKESQLNMKVCGHNFFFCHNSKSISNGVAKNKIFSIIESETKKRVSNGLSTP